MIPSLLRELLDIQLFDYLSFRTAMAGLTAFLLALVFGGPTIAWLKRHRVGEDVTKTDSHLLADMAQRMGKKDTPTMGGSFLIASLLLSVLLWARLDNLQVILGLFLTAGLAAVGFVDDFRKLTVPNSKGLSAKAKMVGQTAVTLFAVAAMAWYAITSDRFSLLTVYPPFFKDFSIPFTGGIITLGLFVTFAWLVIVGTSNAVNITDGLDGLAAGVTIITGLALTIFCYVTGRSDWTEYLNLPYVPAAAEMTVVGGRSAEHASGSSGSTPSPRRSSWATRARCRWAACLPGWHSSPSRSSSFRSSDWCSSPRWGRAPSRPSTTARLAVRDCSPLRPYTTGCSSRAASSPPVPLLGTRSPSSFVPGSWLPRARWPAWLF